MTYAVKEIMYTLQGEGGQTGRPAVFCRFAGCNLWNGLPEGRATGKGGCAKWCDTNFVGTDGPHGGKFQSPEALVAAIEVVWAGGKDNRLVVCTGGEPLLQLDAPLIEELHRRGFTVAVETNGTQLPPPGIDWICVSPKGRTELRLRTGTELKLVFPQADLPPEQFESLDFKYFFLQPKDDAQQAENIKAAVDYCLKHPRWRLSVQTHKVIGIY